MQKMRRDGQRTPQAVNQEPSFPSQPTSHAALGHVLRLQRWVRRCLLPPHLTPGSGDLLGVCVAGPVPVRFPGARSRLRNQCLCQTSLSLGWEAQGACALASLLASCVPCKLLTSTESDSPSHPPRIHTHTCLHTYLCVHTRTYIYTQTCIYRRMMWTKCISQTRYLSRGILP